MLVIKHMKKRQEGMKIACVQSRVSRADGDTECKKIFLGKVVFSKDPKEVRMPDTWFLEKKPPKQKQMPWGRIASERHQHGRAEWAKKTGDKRLMRSEEGARPRYSRPYSSLGCHCRVVIPEKWYCLAHTLTWLLYMLCCK